MASEFRDHVDALKQELQRLGWTRGGNIEFKRHTALLWVCRTPPELRRGTLKQTERLYASIGLEHGADLIGDVRYGMDYNSGCCANHHSHEFSECRRRAC